MYTNEDLKNAVNEGIFTQDSVEKFRNYIAKEKHSPSVDEENFRLISGFNDIFVVIASILLLLSASWVTYDINPLLSAIVIAGISWGLAEFFVRKRKMSLPAIVLLVTFVSSVFLGVLRVFEQITETSLMLSTALAIVAAFLHWKRFAVPITIAAGMLGFVVFLISMFLYLFKAEEIVEYIQYVVLTLGLITFLFAMYWDASDTKRITRNADVAFWLHLLSAPLIVHPVFSLLGIFDAQSGNNTIMIIILLYIVLSAISLIVDRRVFMVSSLVYVLYALNTLFKTYGIENNSFALTGILIGFSLLMLSGYWSKARAVLLKFMPAYIQNKVPAAH